MQWESDACFVLALQGRSRIEKRLRRIVIDTGQLGEGQVIKTN